MNITSRMARRVTATTAAIAAAIAVPAVALAAPGHTAGHASPAAAPRCTSGHLSAWLGIPGEPAAGTVHYQLELSNISGSTCSLYGFPGVSGFGPRDSQLGHAADRDHSRASHRVTLAPGGTAHVELGITNVANFSAKSCQPRRASGLKVYPPGAFSSLEIPFSFSACSKHGAKYLVVTTTLAGTGIPHHSH
jgi:uncharacterized protein DUF4232